MATVLSVMGIVTRLGVIGIDMITKLVLFVATLSAFAQHRISVYLTACCHARCDLSF